VGQLLEIDFENTSAPRPSFAELFSAVIEYACRHGLSSKVLVFFIQTALSCQLTILSDAVPMERIFRTILVDHDCEGVIQPALDLISFSLFDLEVHLELELKRRFYECGQEVIPAALLSPFERYFGLAAFEKAFSRVFLLELDGSPLSPPHLKQAKESGATIRLKPGTRLTSCNYQPTGLCLRLLLALMDNVVRLFLAEFTGETGPPLVFDYSRSLMTLQLAVVLYPALIPFITKYSVKKLVTDLLEAMPEPAACHVRLLAGGSQLTFLGFYLRVVLPYLGHSQASLHFELSLENSLMRDDTTPYST
jgi:hypothetical protein